MGRPPPNDGGGRSAQPMAGVPSRGYAGRPKWRGPLFKEFTMKRRLPITLILAAAVGVLGCGELPSGIDDADGIPQFAERR